LRYVHETRAYVLLECRNCGRVKRSKSAAARDLALKAKTARNELADQFYGQ